MKTRFIIIASVLLFYGCSTTKDTVIEKPFSYREFQASKGTLENKIITVEELYFYRFSTNVQLYVNDEPCYVLLVSGISEKCTEIAADKELSEKVYPPSNLAALYIAVSNVDLIKQIQGLTCGEHIKSVTGSCEYPSMIKRNSCLSPFEFRIPNVVTGILLNGISLEAKT